MSVDIRIDGRSVDLAAGATLGLKLTNPHFDFERVVSNTATMPGFPLTRTNQQIFGYWEQPQAIGAAGGILSRRRLEHYYNGQLIREAQFLLTEAGPGGYAGQMVEPLGEFFGDWQNKLLTELDFGTLPVPAVIPAAGINLEGQLAVVFPTIINPDFYGTQGAGAGYGGRMNPYSGGVYQMNGGAASGPLVPMVMLKWLLRKLALATNTTIDGDFLDHPAYSQLLLYNTRALDGAATITINRHLPVMTPVELILEIRKLFCLQLDFDLVNGRLSMNFFQDAIAEGAVLDWSSKLAGRMVKTPEPNKRLKLGYDLDGGDALMKDKPSLLADYETAGTSTFATIKSQFSTLLTDNATYPDVGPLATTSQPGITVQFGQLSNTFTPRLLFWNPVDGLPKAHNALAGFGLYWNGLAGLYTNHWRELEAMRQAQFWAKASLNLTETDLAGLKWHRKVHINGVNYFVVTVEVTLPIRKAATVLLVAA
ncbi:hypothetical protein [uncultured Fibrella sp.]|uniref:hypothetical protein n=1 Tax=uncultured Fibrella sp. TaxID=1284596 RepID=UPI0035CA1CDC